MYAVIMAGGKGTRIKSISKDIPKPMIKILDKPILEYQIESLKKYNITDIIIVIGYLGDIIKDYFKDGKGFGVNISYIEEKEPLGTAGALYYLNEYKDIDDDFILLFGDIIEDINFSKFIDFHKKNEGYITLLSHPNSHPYDSDLIVADNNKVIRIISKNEKRNYYYKNLVNSGIYIANKKILNYIKEPKKLDFDKDVINHYLQQGLIYSYKSTEYVKDMGTPDRLEAVTNDLKKGIINSLNFENKQKCIFVDRDGTLNESKGYIKKLDDFILYNDIIESIKRINNSSYLVIVITNQPVIARGECSKNDVEKIHLKLETLLGIGGAYIDDIIYCPHHPDKGFVGEVEKLKIECECRKPKIGMIKLMQEKYNIDLESSWMIGDMTIDIKTGKNANLKTILLETGFGGTDNKFEVTPDYKVKTFKDAVDIILNEEN